MFYSLHSSLFAGYGTCVISDAHVTTDRVIESRKHSAPTIHKSLVCQSGMLTSILKVLVVELSGFWFRQANVKSECARGAAMDQTSQSAYMLISHNTVDPCDLCDAMPARPRKFWKLECDSGTTSITCIED